MIINIQNEFSEDYTTRNAGERPRKLIIHASNTTEVISIDYQNLKIASASFFDESIAKLYTDEKWSTSRINTSLRFMNLFIKDEELLISVCKIRGFEIIT